MNELDSRETSELLLGLERVGIRILGIYLLYHGISDLVTNLTSYRQAVAMRDIAFSKVEVSNIKVALIATGAELFMAIFLILGAKGVTNIVRKIRYA